ncbi:MAG: hypothetical protein ABGY95_05975 [Rubritalea sp.]|uniref:TMEM164 family acyltransferase n=1 Tax=Rubritalea sp. TaxID=2109375 RepID=UPI003242028E
MAGELPSSSSFFLQHGGVPVTAILLVWGLQITPEKGAFKRALYWSWGYMALTMTINWAIGQHYGFLNGVPEVRTLFDYMGPSPYYLIIPRVVHERKKAIKRIC